MFGQLPGSVMKHSKLFFFPLDEGMPLPEDVDLQCFLPLQKPQRY